MKQRRCWVGGVQVMAAAGAIVLVMFTSTSVARAQEVGSASSDSRLQKAYRFQQGG